MTNFNDIITSDKLPIIKYDDIRNIDIYKYLANIDTLLDSRQNNIGNIPLSILDRSSSNRISVLSLNNNIVEWNELSNKVKGYDRVSEKYDESFIYGGFTMSVANFNWFDKLTITATKLVPSSGGGRLTTKLLTQGAEEMAWSKLYCSTISECIKFQVTSESTVNGDYLLSFTTLKNDLDIVGANVVGDNGVVASVISEVSTESDESMSNVIKLVASNQKSICVIKSDGSVLNWGQLSSTDFLPPVVPDGFVQVSGSYYSFCGLTEKGDIYSWGINTYTTIKLMEYTPSPGSRKFIFVTAGYDYGIAIDNNYDLVHFGATSRVNSTLFPSRYTTITDGLVDRSADDFIKVAGGYKVGGALRRDGRLHIFGAADYSNLIAGAPTMTNIVDFDVNYGSGIYLLSDGTVGQWGTGFTYTIPSFGTEKIVKVIAGRYIHQAISSSGKLFSWGTSSLINVVGASRSNIIDSDSYNYIGAYVSSDYSIKSYTKVATTSPEADVNRSTPGASITARPSGLVVNGYNKVIKIDKPIGTTNFYIQSSRLGYHTYSTDYRDESYMTMIPQSSVTLIGDGIVEVKYDTTTINTKKLTFFYKVRNNYELTSKLQFDVDSISIGE